METSNKCYLLFWKPLSGSVKQFLRLRFSCSPILDYLVRLKVVQWTR